MTENPDLYARLKDLTRKEWFRRLVAEDRAHPNFWSVIEYGRNSYETRCSRMIRWLLDPRENHGLETFVARRMAGLVAERTGDEALRQALEADYSTNDLDGAETEALRRHRKSGGIDVLYHEKNLGLLIAIENKMYSGEHAGVGGDSQLTTYHDAVTSHPEYGTYDHQLFVFLTGDGHETWEGEDGVWTALSYEDLNAILEEAFARLGQTIGAEAADVVRAEHARKIIGDFVQDNRRKFLVADAQREDLAKFAGGREEIGAILDALGVDRDDDEENEDTPASIAETERIRNGFLSAFAGNLADAKRALELIYENSVPQVQDRVPQVQDHTRNPAAQSLVRMMFNDLVAPEHALATGEDAPMGHEPRDQREAPVVEERFRGLGIGYARVTQSKGQGLHLYFAEEGYTIYISSDVHGALPNDGCTLFPYGENPWGVSPRRVLQGSDKVYINDLDDEGLQQRASLTLDTILMRLRELMEQDPRIRDLSEASAAALR